MIERPLWMPQTTSPPIQIAAKSRHQQAVEV
jgi:hypothetical protein